MPSLDVPEKRLLTRRECLKSVLYLRLKKRKDSETTFPQLKNEENIFFWKKKHWDFLFRKMCRNPKESAKRFVSSKSRVKRIRKCRTAPKNSGLEKIIACCFTEILKRKNNQFKKSYNAENCKWGTFWAFWKSILVQNFLKNEGGQFGDINKNFAKKENWEFWTVSQCRKM